MPDKPVQAAAEGAEICAQSKILDAQDKISESIDFARLTHMEIESLELDEELKALSAGVYAIEKLLLASQAFLEEAKRAPNIA